MLHKIVIGVSVTYSGQQSRRWGCKYMNIEGVYQWGATKNVNTSVYIHFAHTIQNEYHVEPRVFAIKLAVFWECPAPVPVRTWRPDFDHLSQRMSYSCLSALACSTNSCQGLRTSSARPRCVSGEGVLQGRPNTSLQYSVQWINESLLAVIHRRRQAPQNADPQPHSFSGVLSSHSHSSKL